MLKTIATLAVATCAFAFSTPTFAADEFPVQARLFLGNTGINPDNLNDSIEPQGLKKMEMLNQFGLEITYPVMSYLNVGVRYTKRTQTAIEDPDNSGTDYSAKLDQDSLLLVARAPFLKTDIFRLDAFVGAGGSNTTLKVKTAGQDGELTKSAGDGWAASPYAAAGIAASVGYKWIYFTAEVGYESNKVEGFKRSGSVDDDINSLDLSGSYFVIGLMFDGIPGSFKK
jgi:hypothetical protein